MARRLGCLSDVRPEARTPDGAMSVDVLALHAASGRLVAIEADGPSHFLTPGGRGGAPLAPVATGETRARNRALAARGLAVVCVPVMDWNEAGGSSGGHAAYLQAQVEAALARC